MIFGTVLQRATQHDCDNVYMITNSFEKNMFHIECDKAYKKKQK